MNPTLYDNGYAFNVKSHSPLRDERGHPAQRDRAYYRAQELWWRDAEAAAQGRGFTEVQSDGRSGGWLVPVRNGNAITEDDDSVWHVCLSALGEELGRMMQTLDERFTAALDEIMAEDAFEQDNQRAMAAAERDLRDIARAVAHSHGPLAERAKLALLTLGETL